MKTTISSVTYDPMKSAPWDTPANRNGMEVPHYMNSRNQPLDKFYHPIDGDVFALSSGCPCTENPYTKVSYDSVYKPQDLPDLRLPNPYDYETKEEFQKALERWYGQANVGLSGVKLPMPVSGEFYLPEPPKIFTNNEKNNPGRFRTFKADQWSLLPKNYLIMVDRILDQEQLPIDPDELFPEQIPRREQLCFRHHMTSEEQWCSQMVPAEPEPAFYDLFEEYEEAFMNWSVIAMNDLHTQPMLPNDIKKIIKLDCVEEDEEIQLAPVAQDHQETLFNWVPRDKEGAAISEENVQKLASLRQLMMDKDKVEAEKAEAKKKMMIELENEMEKIDGEIVKIEKEKDDDKHKKLAELKAKKDELNSRIVEDVYHVSNVDKNSFMWEYIKFGFYMYPEKALRVNPSKFVVGKEAEEDKIKVVLEKKEELFNFNFTINQYLIILDTIICEQKEPSFVAKYMSPEGIADLIKISKKSIIHMTRVVKFLGALLSCKDSIISKIEAMKEKSEEINSLIDVCSHLIPKLVETKNIDILYDFTSFTNYGAIFNNDLIPKVNSNDEVLLLINRFYLLDSLLSILSNLMGTKFYSELLSQIRKLQKELAISLNGYSLDLLRFAEVGTDHYFAFLMIANCNSVTIQNIIIGNDFIEWAFDKRACSHMLYLLINSSLIFGIAMYIVRLGTVTLLNVLTNMDSKQCIFIYWLLNYIISEKSTYLRFHNDKAFVKSYPSIINDTECKNSMLLALFVRIIFTPYYILYPQDKGKDYVLTISLSNLNSISINMYKERIKILDILTREINLSFQEFQDDEIKSLTKGISKYIFDSDFEIKSLTWKVIIQIAKLNPNIICKMLELDNSEEKQVQTEKNETKNTIKTFISEIQMIFKNVSEITYEQKQAFNLISTLIKKEEDISQKENIFIILNNICRLIVPIFKDKQYFKEQPAYKKDFYDSLAWAMENKNEYAETFKETFEKNSELSHKEILKRISKKKK